MSDEERWETDEEKRRREKHGIHVPPPDPDYQPYSYRDWLGKQERETKEIQEPKDKSKELVMVERDLVKLEKKVLEKEKKEKEEKEEVEKEFGKETVALIGHPFRAKKVVHLKEKEEEE